MKTEITCNLYGHIVRSTSSNIAFSIVAWLAGDTTGPITCTSISKETGFMHDVCYRALEYMRTLRMVRIVHNSVHAHSIVYVSIGSISVCASGPVCSVVSTKKNLEAFAATHTEMCIVESRKSHGFRPKSLRHVLVDVIGDRNRVGVKNRIAKRNNRR